MISTWRFPVASHIQRSNFSYEIKPATKYISSMSLFNHSHLWEQAFQVLWFSKTLEYGKITELKKKQSSPALFSTIFPLFPLQKFVVQIDPSPTETPLNFLAGRTSQKRVQSTLKISQTVHSFQQIPHESGKWGSSGKNPCPGILIFASACSQFTAENHVLKNDENPALFCFVH